MDNDALNFPEMPPAEPRMWPGKRLREARESMQLTLEDVARQLRLDKSLVKALEEDNYDSLPGQTYVYGYLRSYAKLLMLPEDEIVDAIHLGSTESGAPPLLPQNINYRPEKNIKTNLTIVITLLTLVVVVIAATYWILGREGQISQYDHSPFLHCSWAEIQQTNPNCLVVARLEKGRKPESQGAAAPSDLLSGYSPGVAIEYNNDDFNPSSYEPDTFVGFVMAASTSLWLS